MGLWVPSRYPAPFESREPGRESETRRETRQRGHHAPRRGLQPVVPRRRPGGRADGLRAGPRLHGHPAERLRDLGGAAGRPGPTIQGDGARERLLPPPHPPLLPREGGRARRGLRQGVRDRHALPAEDRGEGRRRHRRARSRESSGGGVHHPPDVRDDDLAHVREVDRLLARSADPHQPVGERDALGDAHASVPAHRRVPLAGGPHRPRDSATRPWPGSPD